MKNVEYFKLGNYFVMLHQRLRNSVFAVSGKLPLHKRNQGFILVKLIIFLKATQKVQESFEFMIEIKKCCTFDILHFNFDWRNLVISPHQNCFMLLNAWDLTHL